MVLDESDIEPLPLDYIDIKTTIKVYLKNCWQDNWEVINTPDPMFLYKIKPIISEWKSSNRANRAEEIKITRLRLDTCLFNRKHHFANELHPNCNSCPTPISVKHIILDCPQFSNQRKPIIDYLRTSNIPITLPSILNDDFPHALLFKFLKDIKYLEQI